MSAEREFVLTERLGHDWAAHVISFPYPLMGTPPAGSALALRNVNRDALLPAQMGPDGKVYVVTDLRADEQQRLRVEPDAAVPASDVSVREENGTFILASGLVSIGIPKVQLAGSPVAAVPAPLSWIVGPDGLRRGRGAWQSTVPVTAVRSWISARGPVFAEAAVEYTFANGRHYRLVWRVYSRGPVAIAAEDKDIADGGTWQFSLYPEFAPDRAQLGFGDGCQWTPDYEHDEHICRHIFFNHYCLYQDFKDLSFLYRIQGGPESDALGVFPVNGNAWTDLTTNIISLDTTPTPDVRYSFSLTPGFRSFAFFALPLRETKTGQPSDFRYGNQVVGNSGTGVYGVAAHWSTVRLDDVKDMVLDWPHQPREYPFLCTTPQRLHDRVQAIGADPATYGDLATAHPLLSGTPSSLDKLRQQFLAKLTWMCGNAIEFGPNSLTVNPVFFRPLVDFPFYYETLSLYKALSPDEDRLARARMTFLAYFTDREDYYFGRRSLLPEGHPDYIMSLYKGMRSENFGTDRFIGVGMIGALFPEHPNSARWTVLARDLFDMQMDVLVGRCGAWCEGWNYYWWSLRLLTNYALVMRNVGHDLFAHPKFKAMIRFVVDSLSPRNPVYGNTRTNPGYGSYGEHADGCPFGALMAQAAWAYASTDPDFSAELMWACREITGDPARVLPPSTDLAQQAMVALNIDLTLPARRPARVSHGCPDFGAIFHHAHADGRESYLVARASPYWPHGHTDGGSFFMAYKNAPLVTEAARGQPAGYGLVKSAGSGHNIIRFDDKDPMQYVWPNRQNLLNFVARADVEYAVLDCRQEKLIIPQKKRRGHGDESTRDVNIGHFRHIVYLKPDVFVIYDTIRNAPFASDYRLHVYAESVRFEGNHALFTGRHGIDLDVAVVLPARPVFASTTVVDTHSVEFANTPNQPYLVVLSPREAGSQPPAECALAGDVLTVSVGQQSWRLKIEPTGSAEVCDFRLV